MLNDGRTIATMKWAAYFVVLAAAVSFCHAADDPTESLPGVHDLSALFAALEVISLKSVYQIHKPI